LGQAMEHDIGSQLDWILIDGRGKRIVNQQQDVVPVRAFRRAFDIDNPASWIRWTFDVQDFCLGRKVTIDFREFFYGDLARLYAKAGQPVLDKELGATIEGIGSEQFVSRI